MVCFKTLGSVLFLLIHMRNSLKSFGGFLLFNRSSNKTISQKVIKWLLLCFLLVPTEQLLKIKKKKKIKDLSVTRIRILVRTLFEHQIIGEKGKFIQKIIMDSYFVKVSNLDCLKVTISCSQWVAFQPTHFLCSCALLPFPFLFFLFFFPFMHVLMF